MPLKSLIRKSLRFLDVNEKACSVLGYSREELLSLAGFRH